MRTNDITEGKKESQTGKEFINAICTVKEDH